MTAVSNQRSEINSLLLLSQNCELITLACLISFLLLLISSTCCHVSLFLATLFPVHTVLSYSHFLTLLYALAVTFLSRLLVNLTLSLHLVLFRLVFFTKSLVYLFAAFSGDRCDVILAASYLLSDSIATLCRLPSVSSLPSLLLTSNRACLLLGSSTLVPWLLHAGYHIPRTNQ